MIYVETDSTDVYFNFALEYWLITEKQLPEDRLFLFWRTDPTLMVGKYQNPLEEINIPYAKEHGIHLVRRMSGGGTIYTDLGGWQFTFIAKKDAPRISFQSYILPVVETLRQMGVNADFNGRNDLVIDGRKFSGNAQYMHNGYTLHHGSLLFDTDIEQMVKSTNVDPYKILSKSIKSVRDRVTNISEHLPVPMSGECFRDRMVRGIMGDSDRCYVLKKEEEARVREIAAEKFNNHQAIFGASPKYSIVRTGRYAGGKIEFRLEIVKGRIADIGVFGDFFGTLDTEAFCELLKGCPYGREAVEKRISQSGLDWEKEVYRITLQEMLDTLTEI